jgi:hypothetical protein
VTAVDVAFDPDERGEHAEESPFYSGFLRILGSLIYCDLYAMVAAQTQYPEELWPLAMNHPDLVYAGPTVRAQVERWKAITKMKIGLLGTLVEAVKKEEGVKDS